MIPLHHRLEDPVLGTTFVQDELRTKDLIVVRTMHDGGRHCDASERAVTTQGSTHSIVRFVLEGPIVVRHGGGRVEEIGAGEAIASSDLRRCTSRALTRRTEMLSFAWRAGGRFGARAANEGALDLSPLGRAALVELADAMRARDGDRASGALRSALAALAAAGAPIDPRAVFEPPSQGEREVARAIERVFFPLASRPMAIDLARALGVGERQALRRTNAFFETYYASGSTWREYVHAMRVGLSTFFMSHPRARTEHVSRLLGFASPTSFCHTLHLAGLPSPSAVQRALA